MPTNIILTESQKNGIQRMQNWFKVADQKKYQVFKVQGYAGTGKSTIVNGAIEALGLSLDEVAFATFTGKAASVLNRKGVPCKTIHKLIYNTVMDQFTGAFTHTLKQKYELENYKLIVIDEVSMVNLDLWNKLVDFDIPIVTLGDPGQLPPVGEDNGLMNSCHVFLDEIHRQAEDNPIIYLSMLARTNQNIEYGIYGDNAIVIPKSKLRDNSLVLADQIICGYNETRANLNQRTREILGFNSPKISKGDKVICCMNKWTEIADDYPLVNGTIGEVLRSRVEKEDHYIDFKPAFLKEEFSGLRIGNDWKKKQIPFEFGYAITCHKSQGSEFEKLLVMEERLRGDHAKWLYTAITRASDKLILVK